MQIVFRSPDSERELELSTHAQEATVLDLATAVGASRPGDGLNLDGRLLAPNLLLADAGIYEGAVLSERETPHFDAVGVGTAELCVVAGLEAGNSFPLRPGGTVIGRGGDCDVQLRSRTVSRRHCRILRAADGSLVLEPLSERAATLLDDALVSTAMPLQPGQVIRAGNVGLAVRRTQTDDRPRTLEASRHVRSGGTVAFNRPPRAAGRPPRGPLAIPKPPATSSKAPFSMATMLVPLTGSAIAYAAFHNAAYLMMGLLTPLMAVGNVVEQRTRGRRSLRRDVRRYHSELDALRQDLDNRRSAEVARLRLESCDPAETLRRAVAPSTRLWERRLNHADALRLDVGVGTREWAAPLDDRGRAGLPPEVETAVAERSQLHSVPIAVELGHNGVAGLVGNRVAALATVRSLICQLATIHGPADVRVAVLTSAEHAPSWDWTKWLPHVRAAGIPNVVRLVGTSPAQNELLLRSLLRRERDAEGPLTVVVLDDEALTQGRNAPARALLRGGAGPVAGIVLASGEDRLPALCSVVVDHVDALGVAAVRWPQRGEELTNILVAGVDEATARRCARALARFDDPELHEAGSGLPDGVRLLPLLDPPGLEPAAILSTWKETGGRSDLAAPIGMSEDGPFVLDLVEHGPHALVGGTTGSGKSELLRTVVAGLALLHDPDHLTFVLIDYKGGASFAECAALPHTVGMVTDLDPQLAERALHCLEAELRYREALLARAAARSLPAYLQAGAPMGPLPRLVVIIDEFASMAKELPEFLESLVGIAMRGRTLGVHLILATQRPAGVVSDTIRANVRLRIALRFEDRQDSQDVIDAPDAVTITRTGRAFVRLGPKQVVPIQTALVSAATAHDVHAAVEVRDFTLGWVLAARTGDAANQGESDLARLAAAVTCAFREGEMHLPRRPWPEPLSGDVSLDELLDGRLGSQRPLPAGCVPILLADDPDSQAQYAAGWQPQRGNLLVFGNVGSGTTTTLASVALAAARLRSPDQLHLYVVDFGAGDLAELGRLPQCGAYIRAGERERQVRLVRFLRGELDRRKAGAMAVSPPDLVVILDNYGGFSSEYDGADGLEVLKDFSRVYEDGPAVGISVVISADRPAYGTSALVAVTPQRLLLRLSEPSDYGTLGVGRRRLPTFVPGRAIDVATGLVAQVARPGASIEAAVDAAAAATVEPQQRPVRIEALPSTVAAERIIGAARLDRVPAFIPLGIGERDLEPAGLVLYDHEHAVIGGPSRSGRSTALCVILAVVRAAAPDARVLIVAPRPSPLREQAKDLAVARRPDEIEGLLRRLGPAQTPTYVLVDDADVIDDADGSLAALSRQAPASLHVIATGRTEALRSFGHWTSVLRKSRTGVLLRPTPELDGDLLGVNLPLRSRLPARPGCGYLVMNGAFEIIQVASTAPPGDESPLG